MNSWHRDPPPPDEQVAANFFADRRLASAGADCPLLSRHDVRALSQQFPRAGAPLFFFPCQLTIQRVFFPRVIRSTYGFSEGKGSSFPPFTGPQAAQDRGPPFLPPSPKHSAGRGVGCEGKCPRLTQNLSTEAFILPLAPHERQPAVFPPLWSYGETLYCALLSRRDGSFLFPLLRKGRLSPQGI